MPPGSRPMAQGPWARRHFWMFMCIFMYLYVFLCIFVYLYMYVYIYVYLCVFICIFITQTDLSVGFLAVFLQLDGWCFGVGPGSWHRKVVHRVRRSWHLLSSRLHQMVGRTTFDSKTQWFWHIFLPRPPPASHSHPGHPDASRCPPRCFKNNCLGSRAGVIYIYIYFDRFIYFYILFVFSLPPVP